MTAPPAVLLWYRVFCVVGALFYMAAASAILSIEAPTPVNRNPETVALFLLLFATPTVLFYGIAACVPRKPWGWMYGLVAIAFASLTCLLPFAVALIVFWLKPTTQAAFGRFGVV